jgi:hypothetical protein
MAEITPEFVVVGTHIRVGASTAAAAEGDISVGDGTREMFYDASAGSLALTGGGNATTVVAGAIDTSGALAVGGTTATSIAIGRSGITTDFPSGSTVDFTGATVSGVTLSTILAAGNTTGSNDILQDAGQYLRGAAGTNGGILRLSGGTGSSGVGGPAILVGGVGPLGAGGVTIQGATPGTSGLGGNVAVLGGQSFGALAGGKLELFGGFGGSTAGPGGLILVKAGTGGIGGAGGLTTVQGGTGDGAGDGGALELAGGLDGGSGTDGVVNVKTAGATRWTVGSTGHFIAGTDNSYDIGSEDGGTTSLRPQRVYVGTEVVVGDTITIGTASIDASGSLAIGGTTATSIAIGHSGITTDFPSGSTVDFTGATVTGIPAAGADSLSSVLAIGDTTGANNIVITSGQSVTGANELTLVSTTTGTAAFDSGTTGAVNVGTGASAKTVTVGSVTGAAATTLRAGTGAMTLTAGGIFDVNATGAVTIDGTTVGITSATTNAITIDSGTTGAVNIGTGASAKTVTVGNAASTEVQFDAILMDINGGTGGVTIDAAATGDIALTAANNAASDITFQAHGSAVIPFNTAGDPNLDTTATDIVGAINELQAGAGASNAIVETLTNANAGTMTVGQVVYVTATNDGVDFADATSNVAAANGIAFVQDATILTTDPGNFVTGGTATVKLVAGLGAITSGTTVYLSTTAGSCTTVVPATTGNVIQPIGRIKNNLTYDGTADFLVDMIISFGNRSIAA